MADNHPELRGVDVRGPDHWQTKPVSNGYPPGIVTDTKDDNFILKFLCSACKHLLKEPVQNECGHRYCDECMRQNDGSLCSKCPEESDDEEWSLNYTTKMPDRGIQRTLARLSVRCLQSGCTWVGKFAGYMVHEKQCAPADSLSGSDEDEEDESTFLCPPEEDNPDGTLIWKIDNFPEKLDMAKQGMKRYHESHFFYTAGHQRYKMSAVIYPNGDGMAKGRYMSLFVRIWKGDDDDLLNWPFDRKIEMTLLNQKYDRKHIVDVIRPDPTSSSYQRPGTEKNVPTGESLFCPIVDVMNLKKGFLRGNTMYVKLTIGEPISEICQSGP